MTSRQNQGFTLIELLVVIAIIGVLAAVLLPNLLGARKRAQDVVAKSYLNQALKLQESYQIDNSTYADTTTALAGEGLQVAPQGITLTILDTNPSGYCLSSTSSLGTGTTWYATAESGITRVVCTAAN